jgi:phage baseplate assembly protein W
MSTTQNPLTGNVAYSNFPRRAIFSNTYQVIYLDLNEQFTQNSQQFRVENLDAVNEKILNVLSTLPGERPFEPLFGSLMKQFLFAPMSNTLIADIESEVVNALELWVPEIIVDTRNSNISMDTLNGIIYVSVVYSIPALGVKAQTNVNMYRPQ